jgi:hypothetical protein
MEGPIPSVTVLLCLHGAGGQQPERNPMRKKITIEQHGESLQKQVSRICRSAGKLTESDAKVTSMVKEALHRAVDNSRVVTKIVIAAVLLTLVSAQAGDKDKTKSKWRHEPTPNYILRRQEAGLVRGTPIRSFYVGHRRIDYYRDGSAFEGDNRVN